MTRPRRGGPPIAVFYMAFFGALGFFWPYYGPLLASFDLPASEVTRILSLGPLLGFLTPPLLGLVADARRARPLLLRGLALGAVLSAVGFQFGGHGRPIIYLSALLYAVSRGPIVPLVDASAIEVARREHTSYGRLRLWGSLGFLSAALAGGTLVQVGGYPAMLAGTAVALSCAAVASFWLQAPAETARVPMLRVWRSLLHNGSRAQLLWFLAAVMLASIASAAYDSAFSLHLERNGHGGRFVGVAWGVGVFSEVMILSLTGRIFRWVGAEVALALAIALAGARYYLLGQADSEAAILAVQSLHGVTFGCFWAAGVAVAAHRAGQHAPAAAQGLFSASVALGSFVGMNGAGTLLDLLGGPGLFTLAAGVALAAAVTAVGHLVSLRQKTADSGDELPPDVGAS